MWHRVIEKKHIFLIYNIIFQFLIRVSFLNMNRNRRGPGRAQEIFPDIVPHIEQLDQAGLERGPRSNRHNTAQYTRVNSWTMRDDTKHCQFDIQSRSLFTEPSRAGLLEHRQRAGVHRRQRGHHHGLGPEQAAWHPQHLQAGRSQDESALAVDTSMAVLEGYGAAL